MSFFEKNRAHELQIKTCCVKTICFVFLIGRNSWSGLKSILRLALNKQFLFCLMGRDEEAFL